MPIMAPRKRSSARRARPNPYPVAKRKVGKPTRLAGLFDRTLSSLPDAEVTRIMARDTYFPVRGSGYILGVVRGGNVVGWILAERLGYHNVKSWMAATAQVPNPSKPKARTYAVARAEILRALQQEGWDVRANLKMPHATYPRGGFRLWFKAQAIYESHGSETSSFAGAHSLWIGDIRTMPVEDVLAYIERVRKSS